MIEQVPSLPPDVDAVLLAGSQANKKAKTVVEVECSVAVPAAPHNLQERGIGKLGISSTSLETLDQQPPQQKKPAAKK